MSKTVYIIVRHFVSNSGSYAGMVEEFSKYLSSKKYPVKILCAQVKKELPLYEKLAYAEVIRFPILRLNIPLLGMNKDYILLCFSVKAYLKKHRPNKEDLILANGRAALGVLNYKYALRMGQPAYIFKKNMEIAKGYVSPITRIARTIHFTFQAYLERLCVNNASRIITSSIESKDLVIKYYKNRNLPYFAPHSGVKYSELQTSNNKKYKGRGLLFISAGEERIRKGVVYLEKALPTIFLKYPDVYLLHIGDKFEWNIQDKYKKRIISVGRIPWDKMKHYYLRSYIFVNCALNEWIPNTIFESMAAGIPIVSSDIEGIKEIIQHKQDGYIYKRGDVEGLIQGISFLLDNKSFIQKASKKLKKKARKISYDFFLEKLFSFLNHSEKTVHNYNLLKNG